MGYLKELSSTALGTYFGSADEIGAKDCFESLLCNAKGYKCYEGIKRGACMFPVLLSVFEDLPYVLPGLVAPRVFV